MFSSIIIKSRCKVKNYCVFQANTFYSMTFTALTHKINVNKHYYIHSKTSKCHLDPLLVSLCCYWTTTEYILCAHILVSMLIERSIAKFGTCYKNLIIWSHSMKPYCKLLSLNTKYVGVWYYCTYSPSLLCHLPPPLHDYIYILYNS